MPNLHKLVLWIQNKILDEILWSNQSKFRELYISECTHKQLFFILHHLSNLQTLAFDHCDTNNIDESIHLTQFQQLTSLTIKRMNMLIDELEFLLSLLPSLVYLDLGRRLDSSMAFLQRFCQWEQFILQKLPQLQRFYFEFFSSERSYEDIQSIESIINAFRTPFWLEQKRWLYNF
ncbi:unnamed protein product [Rotaria sp. Silwood1]|nr:unnamed protein product [Rotaria sp. Silwood1]